MSKKTRKSRELNEDRLANKKILGKKDFDTIKEELSDPDAANRHSQTLTHLLINHPRLKQLLIPSFYVLPIVKEFHKQRVANSGLAIDKTGNEQVGESLIRQLIPYINLDHLSAGILSISKEIKIKREKRALLWAFGELAIFLTEKDAKLTDSFVVQAVASASAQYSIIVFNESLKLITEQPPYEFSAQKILDGSFTHDDWNKIITQLNHIIFDVSQFLSFHAEKLFTLIQKPFGFRFYQIIHYPIVAKPSPKSLLVIPGHNPAPEDDESPTDRLNRLTPGLSRDIAQHYSLDDVKDILSSIKSAAFGEVDPDDLKQSLNAAAINLIFPFAINKFLIDVYEKSGEIAEKINPPDEINAIVEIKSAPDNGEWIRRYADLLYRKEQWQAAFRVYKRYLDFIDEPDEEMKNRLETIYKNYYQEINIASNPSPEPTPLNPMVS